MNRLLYLFILSTISASCIKKNQYETNILYSNDEYKKANRQYFANYSENRNMKDIVLNLDNLNLKQFVKTLIADTTDNDNLDILIIQGEIELNCLEDDDLLFLMTKIQSNKKAKCINHFKSSFIPDSREMTLGNQIISIIESYKLGENYPNEICICKKYSSDKIDEILNWWAQKTVANTGYN